MTDDKKVIYAVGLARYDGELLTDDGSIYLHLDNKMAFTMKLIMDELFGENNCRAFITRKKCSTKNYTKNTFGNVSDYNILF
ncbi:hypothetical protein V1224_05235 [Lachnospiraceae bacterium JLR.KK008]